MAPRFNIVAHLQRSRVKIAITGPSGWAGSALIRYLLDEGLAPGDGRLRLLGSGHGRMSVAGRDLCVEPLAEAALGEGPWLVFHCALAQPHRFGPDAADRFAAVNAEILAQAQRLCAAGDVQRFVFLSSGTTQRAPHPGLSAEQLAYRALKLDNEALLQAWTDAGGPPLLIARLYNLGGPYMTHAPGYALGGLILKAAAGGPIEIAAARPVLRSYLHCLDMARALTCLAAEETSPVTVVDMAGPQAVEIGDLAAQIAACLGEPDMPVLRPAQDLSDPDRYVGDPAAALAALARCGAEPASLRQIILDTADYLGFFSSSLRSRGEVG